MVLVFECLKRGQQKQDKDKAVPFVDKIAYFVRDFAEI
jgi:hypothetical protein